MRWMRWWNTYSPFPGCYIVRGTEGFEPDAWRPNNKIQRWKGIEKSAADVLQMHLEQVNKGAVEPYDPIANPSQFDECVVRLAKALEPKQ